MRMHSVTACGHFTKESTLQNFNEEENHPRQSEERSAVNPVMSPYMLHSKAEYRSWRTVGH